MEDWQLLTDYLTTGSETAFRELVERHVRLVHATAQRQVNNAALSEEITQAVFILLARKAPTLSRRTVLVGWLFQTTRFVAARALRSEIRRQQREQEAMAMQELSAPGETWHRLAPVIDEALEGLDAGERNAVLLRIFEERNHREVGAALGITEEAAKKRVQRGLEKLRTRLAREGVVISTAALGTTLLAHGAPPVASNLAATIASSAAVSAHAASASLPVLAQKTATAWEAARSKATLLYSGAAVVLVGLIATVLLRPLVGGTSTSAVTRPENVTSSNGPLAILGTTSGLPQRRVPSAVAERTLHFRVVDIDTGEPAADASLAVNVVDQGEWQKRFDLITDAQGWCNVSYPASVARLDVGVWSPGWAPRFATWYVAPRADPVPAEYVLKASRITNALGGWLRDEQGQPVADGEIWAEFRGTGDASEVLPPRERIGFISEGLCARSDRNGLWSCAMLPGIHRGCQLEVRHPNYPNTSIASLNSTPPASDDDSELLRALKAHQRVTVLRRGVMLRGRLLDLAGNPLAGKVTTGDEKPVHVADAEGWFEFTRLPAGSFAFTALADGFAPKHESVEVSLGMKPIEVRMEPGGVLRLLALDYDDAPVAGARIILEGWSAGRWLFSWETRTGRDGRLEWRSAPAQGDLELCAVREGYCYTREIRVPANGDEHVIRMRPQLHLSGRVTDTVTGRALASFSAVPGYGNDRHSWHRSELRSGTNGFFELPFEENRQPWRVRVEAEGYQPWVSEPLNNETLLPLEISLQPLDPNSAFRGVVVRPDGQPAVGVQVALLTLEQNVRLAGTRFEREGGQFLCVETGPDGKFSFGPDPKAHSVAAVSPLGYAQLRVRDATQPLRVELQPWGRIEGTILTEARIKPVMSVLLDDAVARQYEGQVLLDYNACRVKPDADGHFVFPKVPPGFFRLALMNGYNQPYAYATPVTVRPGDATPIEIKSVGRTVLGRVVAKSGEPLDFSIRLTRGQLEPVQQQTPKPAHLSGIAAELWLVDFWQSPEGRECARRRISWPFQLNADGTFRIEEVLPGRWQLRIFGGRTLNRPVEIPEESGPGQEPVELGELHTAE